MRVITSVLTSNPAGNINPRVSSRTVNGDVRGQERRIRKGADCHGNHVRQVRKLPVQGRAATRAEVIGDDLTAVADPRVRAGRACDPHLPAGISRLNAKGATCPPLASQTVTNRNANGITLNIEGQLSAATARLARSHTLLRDEPTSSIDLSMPGIFVFFTSLREATRPGAYQSCLFIGTWVTWYRAR
jgi:hypothetical protein